MKSIFRYQVPLILWAIIIFILSSLTSIPHVKTPIISADKLAHLAVFFVFCWFSHRALFFQEAFPFLKRWSIIGAFLLTCAYGYFDEVHQLFVPGRSYDLFDFTADALGAILFIVVFLVFTRMRRRVHAES